MHSIISEFVLACVSFGFAVALQCNKTDWFISCPGWRGQLTRLVTYSLGLSPSVCVRWFLCQCPRLPLSFRIARFLRVLPSFLSRSFLVLSELILSLVFYLTLYCLATFILLRCNTQLFVSENVLDRQYSDTRGFDRKSTCTAE